ncbi:MAG: hypothetical protein QOH61_911 [Chloroflexota bacterium]|jgi:hypothetical protein|nr:hypothetical protein [Chloroflexota bacterium]
MTMPAGWTAIAVGQNDIELLLGLLGTSSPDVANLVRSILNLTQARASMVGGDLRGGAAAVPPNVTVLIQPVGLSLDLVGPLLEGLVNQIPGIAGSASREKVSLPSGEAMRLNYVVQPSGGGAPIALRTFVIVRGSQTILITFTAAAGDFDAQQPTFEGIIQSLRFGP